MANADGHGAMRDWQFLEKPRRRHVNSIHSVGVWSEQMAGWLAVDRRIGGVESAIREGEHGTRRIEQEAGRGHDRSPALEDSKPVEEGG